MNNVFTYANKVFARANLLFARANNVFALASQLPTHQLHTPVAPVNTVFAPANNAPARAKGTALFSIISRTSQKYRNAQTAENKLPAAKSRESFFRSERFCRTSVPSFCVKPGQIVLEILQRIDVQVHHVAGWIVAELHIFLEFWRHHHVVEVEFSQEERRRQIE